jgi:glucosamine-phosphate N-acetyltransferase
MENINNSFIFSELSYSDYYNGYLDLMYEFSNYEKKVSFEDFKKYINSDKIKIIVIYDKQNSYKIIGAGTIFKLEKLHNKSVAQIEDVIITENYRKYGLGKLLVEKLLDVGLNEFNCYKVILNCLDKNIGFYEKCDFFISGVQMRNNQK